MRLPVHLLVQVCERECSNTTGCRHLAASDLMRTHAARVGMLGGLLVTAGSATDRASEPSATSQQPQGDSAPHPHSRAAGSCCPLCVRMVV